MDLETKKCTSRDVVFNVVSSYHYAIQNNPNTILEDFSESMQLVAGNKEQARDAGSTSNISVEER